MLAEEVVAVEAVAVEAVAVLEVERKHKGYRLAVKGPFRLHSKLNSMPSPVAQTHSAPH